jgi:holo-[acyl-carrier protein] synthase
MIFGIGTDITQVGRFLKWVRDPSMCERFFNAIEIMNNGTEKARCEHYAARFAAKEAFAKALGTGILDFELKDVYIQKDNFGKPYLKLENTALKVFNRICPDCVIHVSLSHEKEYAVAMVVIEKLN